MYMAAGENSEDISDENMKNRYAHMTTGKGIFTCESCGKKTRDVLGINLPYCKKCIEKQEHENFHIDQGDKYRCEDPACQFNSKEESK